jgi:hypothetical protein
VLAGPFVHDQPSEVWLLAKIKFFLKPRKRIWDQSGIKDLVTITVPKKIERTLTDGLSQTEVKSKLHALANTLDSRGWAVKNVNVNLYAQPSYATASTDRLIDGSVLPQQVPDYDTYATDDILDETNNPTAQQLRQMVSQSTQAHRQQLIAQMQQQAASPAPPPPQPQANYWFVDPVTQSNPTPPLPDEQTLNQQIKQRKQQQSSSNKHLRTLSPTSGRIESSHEAPHHVDPSLVNQLAQNNDLNVATIARQVNKPEDDNEVVVSLR